MIIIGIDLGEIRIKSISHSQHDNSRHCQLTFPRTNMAGRERRDCARIPDVSDLTFPHGKWQGREDEAAALHSHGDGRSRQVCDARVSCRGR
jgi:hypothetical protein